MPNRIIKESLCYSHDIDQLTSFEETVFVRLIVNVDDYGRIDARPSFLKSKLFVTKSGITEKNVSDALLKLASVGLIRFYEVDGKSFLLFPTWSSHQQIRATKSKWPEPVSTCNQMISSDIKCTRNPIQSKSESKMCESFFESIWKLYPEKKGKGQVKDAQKKRLYDIGYDEIARCIERYKKDKPDWKQYQNGSTFFNSGYVDYLDENYSVIEEEKKRRYLP